MSILDGIANSSNRAAAGYFQNMQAADERDANAFNRRRIEQSDAYAAEDRNYLNKQRQFEQMKAVAQEAVDYYVGAADNPNRDAEIQQFMVDAANDLGLDPNQPFVEMIRGKATQLQGSGNKVFQPQRIINEDGTESLVMPSESGMAVPVGLPPGSRLAPQVTYVDAGNARIPVTRTGVNPGLSAIPIAPRPQDMPEFQYDVRAAQEQAVTDAIAPRAMPEATAAATKTNAVETAKNAVAASQAAIESLGKVRSSALNIDEAISAIDAGAQSGVVMSKIPSVQSASVELDNIRGRMGLDIVGATTFGALSEAELAFALDVALPTNLDPPALREWLVRKKAAQQKLADQLEDAAIYLQRDGNTQAGYLEYLRNNKKKSDPVSALQQNLGAKLSTSVDLPVGTVDGGYVYKGGDPSLPESWEQQ